MSHDRGCFKCGDDSKGHSCSQQDCPYREKIRVDLGTARLIAKLIRELEDAEKIVKERKKALTHIGVFI